jgi:hypothetical protein
VECKKITEWKQNVTNILSKAFNDQTKIDNILTEHVHKFSNRLKESVDAYSRVITLYAQHYSDFLTAVRNQVRPVDNLIDLLRQRLNNSRNDANRGLNGPENAPTTIGDLNMLDLLLNDYETANGALNSIQSEFQRLQTEMEDCVRSASLQTSMSDGYSDLVSKKSQILKETDFAIAPFKEHSHVFRAIADQKLETTITSWITSEITRRQEDCNEKRRVQLDAISRSLTNDYTNYINNNDTVTLHSCLQYYETAFSSRAAPVVQQLLVTWMPLAGTGVPQQVLDAYKLTDTMNGEAVQGESVSFLSGLRQFWNGHYRTISANIQPGVGSITLKLRRGKRQR